MISRCEVLARGIGREVCSGSAGIVSMAPVFLSPHCSIEEVMHRLVEDVVAGDEVGDSEMNGCSDTTDRVVHQLVGYVIADGGSCNGDVNECSDVHDEVVHQLVKGVVVVAEVCNSGVRGCSLLSPRLLSPGS